MEPEPASGQRGRSVAPTRTRVEDTEASATAHTRVEETPSQDLKMSAVDGVLRRRKPELHDDVLRRKTTHYIDAVETKGTVKGFHPEPWLDERDHSGTPKDMTPTSITAAGAGAQVFGPEPLTRATRGTLHTCPPCGKTCRHQTRPPEHDLGTATSKAPPIPGSPSATPSAAHTAKGCNHHRRQDAC